MFEKLSDKKMFGFLLVVIIFAIFTNINLEKPDLMESRNFITAREMVQDGCWLIPTMNGEIRIAKPPFPTWITAIAYKFSGTEENVGILRIPAALSTTLMIFLFFGFVFSLTKNKSLAFVSSIVLATSFLIIKMGKTASWDIYTNVFMVGALYFLLKSREKIFYSWIAGIFFGLSFMSKGPVSVFAMFIPFIISYFIIYKVKIKELNIKKIAAFLISSLIIGGLWYAYIYGVHSDVAVKIAKTESESWLNRHTKPFWYYLDFPIFSGVWLVFVVMSLFKGKVEKIIEDIKVYRFTLLWMVVSLVLISILPEKKERYLLPVVIPAAALVGQLITSLYERFKENRESKLWNNTLKVHSIIMVTLSMAIPIIILVKGYRETLGFIAYLVIVFFGFFGISGLFIFFMKKKDVKNIFILTAIVMLFTNITFTGFFVKNIMQRQNNEFENLIEIKKTDNLKGLKIYTFQEPGIENVWRIGDKIKMIDSKDLEGLSYPIALFCYENELEKIKPVINSGLKITNEYIYYEHSVSKKKVLILRIEKTRV